MEQNGLISTDHAVNVNQEGEQPINIIAGPTGNDDPTQPDVNKTSEQVRKQLLKDGAKSFSKYLFWTHVIGVILLSAGFVLPGWLTVKARQSIYESDGTFSFSNLAFQDYSLWYITQCTFSRDVMYCDAMTYRIIDAALKGTCGTCRKLQINEYETDSFMMFAGVGLVFSYSELVFAQVLYTLGMFIAVYVFRELYTFRKTIMEGQDVNMTTKSWLVLLSLESLCACFVLYPSFMFLVMDIKIGPGVQTPFGSVIAVLGGSMVTIVSITLFLQILCCRNTKGVYLCYSELDSEDYENEESV